MKPSVFKFALGLAFFCLVLSFAQGQRRYNRGNDYDSRAGVPNWQVDSEFKKDVFIFARVKYSSSYGGYGGYGGWGRRGRGGWATDYPDAELNLAYRLQQMTSLKVNPDSVVVELTQPDLFNYPFLYIIEPGRLVFLDEEVTALRNYLLNGGFLMVDDFWGEAEYENFYYEIKRVFPEREPVELPIEHPIFHMVFDLKESRKCPLSDGLIPARRSPGSVPTPRKSTTRRSSTITGELCVSSATIRISAMAGNAKAKTNGTSASSPKRKPTRWASISSSTR